jgi:hypothetical protein
VQTAYSGRLQKYLLSFTKADSGIGIEKEFPFWNIQYHGHILCIIGGM